MKQLERARRSQEPETETILDSVSLSDAPERLTLFFSLGLVVLYVSIYLLAVFIDGLEFFRNPVYFLPAVFSMLLPAAVSRTRFSKHAGILMVICMAGYIGYMSFAIMDLADPIMYFLAISFPLILAPPLRIRPGHILALTGTLIGYMVFYILVMGIPEPALVVFPVVFCSMTGLALWYLTKNTEKTRGKEEVLTQSLSRLYQFAMGWSKTPDFDTALQAALDVLVETFPDSRIAIMLPDQEWKNLIIRASAGYPFQLDMNYSIPASSGLTGWSFQSGEQVRVGDVTNDGRYVQLDPDVCSEMCIPLRVGSQTIGVINLESVQRMAYSRDEEQFLATMGPLLTSFILNAQLQLETSFLGELNETLLETAPAGMITYSYSGDCVYVNEAMALILGENLASVLSKNLYDQQHWEDLGLTAKAREAFRTSTMQKIEPDVHLWNGEQVIEYYLKPFSVQREPYLLVMAVNHTQQARMQRALEDERNFISTVLENASALVMVVDEQGKVRRFNAACERMAGISEEDAFGCDVNDVMRIPSGQAFLPEEVFDHSGEGKPVEFTAPYNLGDGEIRTISWSNTVVTDARGALDFVVVVGQDITEEQALTDRLRLQSEALISAVNGIVITDTDGTIEWVNPAVTRLTGYGRQELLGKNPRILKSNLHEEGFYSQLWKVITAGRAWHGRLINQKKDGSMYHEEMTITPVRDDTGNIRHFIAIKSDVSEQVAMEKALRESEARFRAIITGASVGLFVGSREGRFIEVNPALAVMLGYSVEELSQLQILDLIHPSDEEESVAAYGSLLDRSQERVYLKVRIIRRNGQLMWARVSLGLIRDDDRSPVYVIGIIEDVTEHHWAEEALEQSEKRLEQISNSVDQCIYSFSITGDGVLVSPIITPSISKLSGYDVSEHLQNPDLWLDVIHPDDRDQVNEKYAPHTASEERVFFTYRVVDRRGRLHWIKDDIYFEFDDSGHPIRMGGVLTDITELKRAQAALEEQILEVEKANVRLRELDRLKSNFLANISHELRTPLNSIIGFAELLVDGLAGELNSQQQEFMEDIHSSGKHLLELINDILDLSKIEAGRLNINPESFDFAALVEETTATIIQQYERKNQSLYVEIQENLPEVYADRIRIKQVLLNLLSNANKFTLERGEVRVQASMLDQSAMMVSVADTGIGIAEEDYDSVFAEFQQVDSSATREAEGTGLGIPISRKIIEMHGGRLWLESVLGQGTTFTFILPFVGPVVSQFVGERVDTYLAVEGQRPLVLIVEDDRSYANILGFHFSMEGFDIRHVGTGQEALSKALELDPCLVTLDLMLPDMDGWELLEVMKSEEGTADIPVVVLSALKEGESGWGRWREQGAAAYLVKPVHHDHILDLLERLNLVPHPRTIALFDAQPGLRQIMQGLEGCLHLEAKLIHPTMDPGSFSAWEEVDLLAFQLESMNDRRIDLARWVSSFAEQGKPVLGIAYSEDDLPRLKESSIGIDEAVLAAQDSNRLFRIELMKAYTAVLRRKDETT